MKDTIQLLEKIVDHAGICLRKEDDIELIFLLKEEPMEDTHFSIDVYKEVGDIYANDLYLISNNGKDNQH